jgi:hypothetical protein
MSFTFAVRIGSIAGALLFAAGSSLAVEFDVANQQKVRDCVTGFTAAGAPNAANRCSNETLLNIQIRAPDDTVLTGTYRLNMTKCSSDPDQPKEKGCVVGVRGTARIQCATGATCARSASVVLGCIAEYDGLSDDSSVATARYISRALCGGAQIRPVLTGMVTESGFSTIYDLPECGPNQTLEFRDFALRCADTAKPPTCAANEIVSYDGTTYKCFPKVPTCAPNTYLSFYGGTWHCDPVVSPSNDKPPTCTSALCPDAGTYCAGEGYVNSASNCVCAGTKVCL